MTPHTGSPGWDHVLDEMDHPGIVQAEHEWAERQVDLEELHKKAAEAHLID